MYGYCYNDTREARAKAMRRSTTKQETQPVNIAELPPNQVNKLGCHEKCDPNVSSQSHQWSKQHCVVIP